MAARRRALPRLSVQAGLSLSSSAGGKLLNFGTICVARRCVLNAWVLCVRECRESMISVNNSSV